MESVGVNVIETAALGRPFQLGMLYDCRTDALIPGIRLWTKEQIEQNSCTRPQIKTRFNVTASDTIKDKSKLLDIHGELKLSFLGGLLNVSGAADYLKDTKSSFNQQRLTLHYHSSSRFEELTVNHLPSEKIPEADSNNGTHIVTGILYGADACFVFDREVSSDEETNKVKGEANLAFEKLQSIVSVSGNAKINMDENQQNMVKNFKCTFYGDFQLQSNPASFEDALSIFADLPKLLKENQKLTVPLRVWLYPLDKLLSIESKLLKDISLDLIMKTEAVIESLNTAEMKCGDLLRDSPALMFAEVHDKISQMKQNCNIYKLILVKQLGSLLPNIRGDLMKETALNDLLQDYNKSPFKESDLAGWLKERESESENIKSILIQLTEVGKTKVNLDTILMDLEVENLVSYTFTSLNCSDELILQQTAYLSPSTQGETDKKSIDSKLKSWLTPEIQMSMRRNLMIFKNLIDSKDRKPAKFIVSFKEMKNNPGSCILLHESDCESAFMKAVCFTPPSQPVCPIVEEVKDTSVVLKVPPSCPDTVELRLLYKPKQDSVWRSEPILKDQDTVTLTDLREETEYEIKCAALGKLDYTRESDVTRVTTEQRKENNSAKEKKGMDSISLTTAEDMRAQTKLMMQPFANWEEYLTPAPLSIAMLGELVSISSTIDFSVNKNAPKEGYRFVKHPQYLSACIRQVCNSVCWAFNEAHKSMGQIRHHTDDVPDHMKTAEKILFQDSDEVIRAHLPDQLDHIRDSVDECMKLSYSTEQRFTNVICIIQELLEACVNAEHFYGEEINKIKKKLKESKLREQNWSELRTTIAMLVKVMDAMGRVKEQLEKTCHFFQMISIIVKANLSKSLKNFVSTSEKTQALSYSAKFFSKDLLYTQAFQASNIASLIHMISATYADVYLMDCVSSLDKLTIMGKNEPEFEQERMQLQNSCDEAQKGILRIVPKNKEKFDRKSTDRLERISQELLAFLPDTPPEQITSIGEVVQAGFTEEEEEEEEASYY